MVPRVVKVERRQRVTVVHVGSKLVIKRLVGRRRWNDDEQRSGGVHIVVKRERIT